MSDKIVNHFVLADGSTAKYDAGNLLNLDETVSHAGFAPDAKAVGDRLTDVENLAETLNEGGLELKDEVIGENVDDWMDTHPEASTTVQDGAITEPKINSAFLKEIKNAYVTPEMFGAVGDGVTDDTIAIQSMLDSIAQRQFCIFKNTYLITAPVYIKETVNIQSYGVIKLSENGRLQFGTSEKQLNGSFFKFARIEGDGNNGETIAIDIENAAYNSFEIGNIFNVYGGILFNEQGINGSTGQNLFRINHIRTATDGIAFKGATSWELAPWAEGNNFLCAFISKCSHAGLFLDENIKCGCTIFMGAIDCEESTGEDVIDNMENVNYHQPNIFISNFMRPEHVTIGETETVIDTQTGIKTYPYVISRTGLRATDGVNDTTVPAGSLEITNNQNPYIDMKNSTSEDFDVRLIGSDTELNISAGDRTNHAYGFTLHNNQYVKAPLTGRIAVDAGATQKVIGISPAMPDNNYSVIATPSWGTTCYCSARGTGYATINFGTAVPSGGGYVDYLIQYNPS